MPREDASLGPSGWVRWGLVLVLLLGWSAMEAQAQRPFRMSDPFYRNETARRTFFDRMAFSAEVSYRPMGVGQGAGGLTAPTDPLGLRFRADYQLSEHFDVGGIIEALGTGAGRSLSLNWIVVKYYRYLDAADYAVRLAVDPASDGRVGFPMVDLAFLYTSLLSPTFSSDFALGVRRVNVGYAQYLPREEADQPLEGPYVAPGPTLLSTQAFGTELHAMMNYNVHFDPAGSNIYVALLAEGGQYDLVETPLNQQPQVDPEGAPESAEPEDEQIEYRGGVVWLRAGAELSRPSYQVAPYIAAPIQQWRPDDGDWTVAQLHIGVRFMLR
jgi:hypothetical protein